MYAYNIDDRSGFSVSTISNNVCYHYVIYNLQSPCQLLQMNRTIKDYNCKKKNYTCKTLATLFSYFNKLAVTA